jgi:hypothetical protein
MRVLWTVPVGLAIAMSGCFTVERVGRPPSPADVARINEAARFSSSLAVAYVPTMVYEPVVIVPTTPPPRMPPCAGGSCAAPPAAQSCAAGRCNPAAPPVRPACLDELCNTAVVPRERIAAVSIASADARQLTLNLKGGDQLTLPLDDVAGLSARGAGRARGAAIGAAIGGGNMLALVGLAFLVGNMEPGPDGPGARCDSACRDAFIVAGIGGAAVGALIGALIGTSRRFVFVDDAAPYRQ